MSKTKRANILSTREIAYMAILIALNIVLTRYLSIQTTILRIGFSFISIAVLSMLVNPLASGIAATVADVIGYFAFPTATYFPGFTLSAFLYGAIYGLFYYKKDITIKNIIISNVIIIIFIDLCLNTLWLILMYGMSLDTVILARLIKCAAILPIQIIIIYLMYKLIVKKYLLKEVII